MSKNFKLFLKEIINRHTNANETKASIIIQNLLDLSKIKNAKSMIVFLTPPTFKMSGGVMSIFSLCESSRKLNICDCCLVATYPGKYTYVINDKFNNNEKVYRFEQIVENAKNLQELIIHIPEYYANNFYKRLSIKEKEFLTSIPKLYLNIMNQNIELMPKPSKLKSLYKLTKNITQTIAHERYATQEICDKWQIPTHLFSVNIDLSKYRAYDFQEKEKIIVLSPDVNEYKEEIIKKIEKDLPEWKLITIQNMTFNEYMDLISKAYFTITFGEGMDGYFIQPHCVGSIGFAVYNDNFFPDNSWKDLQNVYLSYDDMLENIVNDIKMFSSNEIKFRQVITDLLEKSKKVYNIQKFEDNLKMFYNEKYDFIPRKGVA